ncbi:hypothetical protein [Maridesulfovibrio sp.]|jgi:hypothetical protein|uniref:hypothetical protein n=1 Tax=Maridesulfovibrio sp. TaxID=2795000 RepID=UPI0029C9DA85|nr:hypothetical protein [Maridesulfovibrio sp.]
MLILTDLTRFNDSDNVCMALLDEDNCICYRPLPYENLAFVEFRNIRPGIIVSADVVPSEDANYPHVEDCKFENDVWLDCVDEDSFKDLLERSAVDSINEAFEGIVTPKNRCVPVESPCSHSIRTIRVEPKSVSVSVIHSSGEMKLRLGFTDKSGVQYRHTPIADLCFHRMAMKYVLQDRLDELSALLAGGHEVYIRAGLSRLYESKNGKQGFWMQANGVYIFPGYYCL